MPRIRQELQLTNRQKMKLLTVGVAGYLTGADFSNRSQISARIREAGIPFRTSEELDESVTFLDDNISLVEDIAMEAEEHIESLSASRLNELIRRQKDVH